MLYLVGGAPEAIKTAKSMGITTLNSDGNYGLSLVLGSGEVKLAEMVGAYSVFANEGKFNQITPVLEIQDGYGKKIYEYKSANKRVLDPQVAYLINHTLSDNSTRAARWGTTNLVIRNRHNVAAKTGTTSSSKDGWTIGYTTQLAAGVWAGNNDASPITSGDGGLTIAGPIWNEFMRTTLDQKGYSDESFPRPKGIVEIQVDKMSNKLPTDQTPPDTIVTDVFASWQVPTEKDDVHVKARIDKYTNKLATDKTPQNAIIEKYYTVIHSELPDKPTWENPVRGWAQAVGLANTPPTEYDDIHKDSNKPIATIKKPTNGSIVSGNIEITSTVSSTYKITEVEYFVDNKSIGFSNQKSYRMVYSTSSLKDGSHNIKVIARNEIALEGEDVISIKISKDTFPPSDVTNISATALAGSVKLQWKNPSNIDLDFAYVYISTEAEKLGTKYSSKINISPSSISSTTISNLTSGKKYYFIIHPVDLSGNENQSASQISALVL